MSDRPIAIVGLGIVGLMMALWLLKNNLKVVLFENRTFTRKQIVYLSRNNWHALPLDVRDALKRKGNLCRNGEHPLVCEAGENVNVQINSLQQELLDYILTRFESRLVLRRERATIEALAALDKRLVILADGGGGSSIIHSLWEKGHGEYQSLPVSNAAVVTFNAAFDLEQTVRESVFFEDKQKVYVTFRTEGGTGYIATQLSDESFQQITHEPEPEVALPVSVRDRLRQFDPKSLTQPPLTQQPLPQPLLQSERPIRALSSEETMRRFLDTPEGHVYSMVMARSGFFQVTNKDITIFPITLRSASLMYLASAPELGGVPVFLVGDAAFTGHFFTGMGANSGIDCARQLCHLILSDHQADWYQYHWIALAARDKLWRRTLNVLVDLGKDKFLPPSKLLGSRGNPTVEKAILKFLSTKPASPLPAPSSPLIN